MKNFFFVLAFTLIQIISSSARAEFGLSSVKAGVISPTYQTKLSGPAGPDIEYQPTPENILGVAANFGPLLLFFSGSSTNADDKLKYGDSETSQFLIRFQGANHSFELDSKTTKSFYINNSESVTPGWSSQNRIQRPDLTENKLHVNYYYTFSPETFHMGILDQSMVPKGNGGSLILGAHYMRTTLSGNTFLVPTSQAGNYGKMGTLKEYELNALRVGVGGGYVLEISGVYLAGLLYYSAGPEKQKLTYTSSDENGSVLSLAGTARLSLGYNMEHFFTALNANYTQEDQDVSDGKVSIKDASGELWVGWRF